MNTYENINATHTSSETDSFTLERYKQFYSFLPPTTNLVEKTVLDIGCNTGRGGVVLKEINPHLQVSGLDCVKDRLDALPKNIYENAIHGTSTSIPCNDNTFDAVVAGEFIEHLSPSDVDATLCEIFRILKLRGRLLITTPNPLDIKKKLRQESVLGTWHLSQHFPDTLKLKLRMIGFSHVRFYGSGKVTRYLGYHFPYLHIYGSYLAIADKF
jgi:ubiquinone/menaquinone biosynthesis C-methylase UbiE